MGIRRRCATEEIVPKCETSVSNGWAMKDCFTTCKGAMCNDDLSIANMLSDDVVSECYSCKFNEFTAGAHNDTMDCNCRQKTKQFNRVPCGLLPPVLSLTPSSAPKWTKTWSTFSVGAVHLTPIFSVIC